MTSIRLALTRKLLFALCSLLAAGLISLYFSVCIALKSEFKATLQAKALAITTAVEQQKNRVEVEFTNQFMAGFDATIATDFYELRHPDGTVIKRSESLGAADLPRKNGTLSKPKYWYLTLPNRMPGLAIAFNFTPKPSGALPLNFVLPELNLVVAVDRRSLDERLGILKIIILTCGLLLVGATVVILPNILKKELRPLEILGDQTTAITAESLASRFPTESLPAELLSITQRLNDLLARLEQSFERERRFSADLAHELRTPIAELRSLIECALKWPETRDPATDKEILAVTRHMEGIVSRMLTLARSERGQLQLNRETIDLSKFVENAWKPFSEKAVQKEIGVRLKTPSARVSADTTLLRSILANLFENAVEYTPRRGEIGIEASADKEHFVVLVSNTVDNFEPSDVSRLFDRFWRREASRTGQEHTGLGLSLAREFAKALDWQLTAVLNGKNAMVFTLEGRSGA